MCFRPLDVFGFGASGASSISDLAKAVKFLLTELLVQEVRVNDAQVEQVKK